jgi:hypothetical protein
VEPAYIILGITVAWLGVTVASTFAVRISNLITNRRLDAYQATVREWFAQYAVGAREDWPPPGRSRMQRRVMRGDLQALAPEVTGTASERIAALFVEYGFVEAVHRDLA